MNKRRQSLGCFTATHRLGATIAAASRALFWRMMPLRAYLLLRVRLLGRLLREIGWLRLVLLAPVLLAAVGQGLAFAAPHPLAQWAVPLLVFLTLASAHRQRADLRFLFVSAPHFRRWLAVEYGLIALPAAVALVLFQAWGAALLTLTLPATAAAARATPAAGPRNSQAPRSQRSAPSVGTAASSRWPPSSRKAATTSGWR